MRTDPVRARIRQQLLGLAGYEHAYSVRSLRFTQRQALNVDLLSVAHLIQRELNKRRARRSPQTP